MVIEPKYERCFNVNFNILLKQLFCINLFNDGQTQKMFSPDYRVS